MIGSNLDDMVISITDESTDLATNAALSLLEPLAMSAILPRENSSIHTPATSLERSRVSQLLMVKSKPVVSGPAMICRFCSTTTIRLEY